jgi:hypothetical protein
MHFSTPIVNTTPKKTSFTNRISGYCYTIINIKLTINRDSFLIYIDTRCLQPLIDKRWIGNYPSAVINYSKKTKVKGVSTIRIKLQGLATFNIYIPGTLKEAPTIAKVKVQAWVTKNLKPLLLLRNRFLKPYKVVIDLN